MAEEAPAFPTIVEAARHLGCHPDTLRYHLKRAGCAPIVREDAQAHLTCSLERAEEIMRTRPRQSGGWRDDRGWFMGPDAAGAELPGIAAQEVARRLGIQTRTVYQLNQLGYLLAEWELRVDGRRVLRWDPVAVGAYARRVGRTLAE